jgi:hypothetical protein
VAGIHASARAVGVDCRGTRGRRTARVLEGRPVRLLVRVAEAMRVVTKAGAGRRWGTADSATGTGYLGAATFLFGYAMEATAYRTRDV